MHRPFTPAARDAFIAAGTAIQGGAGRRTTITPAGVRMSVESALFAVVGNDAKAPGLLAEDVRALVGDQGLGGSYDALARRLVTEMVHIEIRRAEERETQQMAAAEAAAEQRKLRARGKAEAEAVKKRAARGQRKAVKVALREAA